VSKQSENLVSTGLLALHSTHFQMVKILQFFIDKRCFPVYIPGAFSTWIQKAGNESPQAFFLIFF